MITLRRSKDRRHIRSKVQDTCLTFDPENAADPFRRGFRSLESFNEETPLSGMSLHPHTQDDIEILTYVREGAIIHQDRAKKLRLLKAGEFQRMSVRWEIRQRVVNGSFLTPAKVFQSCITADGSALKPGIEQKYFPVADRKGVLLLVASLDGRRGSLCIRQNAQIYSSLLLRGHHSVHAISVGRGAWFHVIKGRVLLGGYHLGTGDAVGLEDEAAISFTAQISSEILLFDLA